MLVEDRIHQCLSLPFSPQYLKNINIPSTWQIFFSIAVPNNDYLKNPLENQVIFFHILILGPTRHVLQIIGRVPKLTLTFYLMSDTFDFLLPLKEEIYSNTLFESEQKSTQAHFRDTKNHCKRVSHHISELSNPHGHGVGHWAA